VIFGKEGDNTFVCTGRKRKILRVKRGAIPKQRKDAALIPKPEAGDTYAGIEYRGLRSILNSECT